MIKRIGVCLISLFLAVAAAGCNALVDVPEEKESEELPALAFEADKMCGFFIVFYDKEGNALTDENFESDQAVKYYMARRQYGEEPNSYYMETVVGKDVWSDGKISQKFADGKEEHSYEVTVNFTAELVDAVMVVNGVYYGEAEQRYYAESGGVGHTLQDFGSGSGGQTQTLTASRTNPDGTKEEISYVCSVTVNYRLIDNLTGVKILEYGADNTLLASHRYAKGSGFTTSEDCAYVVVEKEYTVVHDYEHDTVKYLGMTYCEREIVERPMYGSAPYLSLLYPCGDGFVDREMLNIKFA